MQYIINISFSYWLLNQFSLSSLPSLSSLQALVVLLVLSFLPQCHYDATPPDVNKLNDQQPRIQLLLTDFVPQDTVVVQVWDRKQSALLGHKFDHAIDSDGRLLLTLVLAQGTVKARFLAYIDRDNDQKWTALDVAYLSPDLILNDDEHILQVRLSPNDFRPLSAVFIQGLQNAALGNHRCIFTPDSLMSWSVNFQHKHFNRQAQDYALSDWPMSVAWNNPSSQTEITLYLLSEHQYSSRCILDHDQNDVYNAWAGDILSLPFASFTLSNEIVQTLDYEKNQ